MLPRWLPWIFQWSALLPLAAALVRRSPARAWWIAGAFAVSWVADTIAAFLPGDYRWMVSATYPVLQAGLLYVVLGPWRHAAWLTALTGFVAVVGAPVWAQGSTDSALRITIALAIMWLVRNRSDLGLLRTGVLVYFAGGALTRVGLPFVRDDPALYLALWLGYQGCRLVGLGFVTWGIWRDR